jgi:ribonuclease HII
MPHFQYEQKFSSHSVAGVDEVGYGAWAGPIVVAGVIFDTYDLPPFLQENINDSKSVTAAMRDRLFEAFTSMPHLGRWETFFVSVESLTKGNVLQETLKAMTHVADTLKASAVLVDGCHRIPSQIPQKTLPKGDHISFSIAMASIIAKVTRDRFMETLSHEYPSFSWDRNKGYGTRHHQEALIAHGLTIHHRPQYCRRILSSPTQLSSSSL